MIGILFAVSILGPGIILVTSLLVLNLTVVVGTINGLNQIFYANIVGSTSEPLIFALPQFVVAWLNLESGFEGCFVNELNAYWRTWLKFAFPILSSCISNTVTVFHTKRVDFVAFEVFGSIFVLNKN
jgi:hypothetical protein